MHGATIKISILMFILNVSSLLQNNMVLKLLFCFLQYNVDKTFRTISFQVAQSLQESSRTLHLVN